MRSRSKRGRSERVCLVLLLGYARSGLFAVQQSAATLDLLQHRLRPLLRLRSPFRQLHQFSRSTHLTSTTTA